MFSVDTVRIRCGFCRVDFLAVKRKQNLPGTDRDAYRVRCPVCNTATSVREDRPATVTGKVSALTGLPEPA